MTTRTNRMRIGHALLAVVSDDYDKKMFLRMMIRILIEMIVCLKLSPMIHPMILMTLSAALTRKNRTQ